VLVCHCNRVTFDDLRTALADEPTDVEGVRHRLGIGAGCGGCRDYANALVEHFSQASVQGHRADKSAAA